METDYLGTGLAIDNIYRTRNFFFILSEIAKCGVNMVLNIV